MQDKNNNTTIEVTELDILFGKTDYAIHHVGNVAFRTLLGHCAAEHGRIPKRKRSKKGRLLLAITHRIIQSGGRFLKRNNEQWEQVSKDAARDKAGQILRDAVRRKPRILHSFSFANTADIRQYFKSPYDFDWKGIVQVCSQKLEEEKLQRREEEAIMSYWEEEGAAPVEPPSVMECPECKFSGAMGLLQLKQTERYPRVLVHDGDYCKCVQCRGPQRGHQAQKQVQQVHPWDI